MGSPPHLLDLNASIRNNLFVKFLCFSVRITQLMISTVGRYCRLLLIATPHYALAKTTYQGLSTLIRPIIRLIKMHLVNSMQFINLARFINPHHVNRTNEILLTMAIREVTKKGYIKLLMKNLIHIQRASIQPWSR